MNKHVKLWLLALLVSWTGMINAQVLVTTAEGNGADTWVGNDTDRPPGLIHGDSYWLDVRYNPTAPRLRMTLLRFDISRAAGDLSGATLSLYDEDSRRARDWNVYGLMNEDYDNWPEYETSYLNAPGFVDEGYGIWGREEGAYVLLGSFPIAGGEATSVSNPTDLNLTPLLEADTNGLITLVIIWEGDNFGDAWSMPISKENPDAVMYPTLTLPHARQLAAPIASAPTPANFSVEIYAATDLDWTPGDYAATHTLYLSPNFDDVNEGLGSARVAEGLTEAVYTPSELLDVNQIYYWRVDEVNAAPDTTVYPGPVWSFTTEREFYLINDIDAVASSSENDNRTATNLVDGSGLDGGMHGQLADTMWSSGAGDSTPTILFTFPRIYSLAEIKVWNSNGDSEDILGYSAKGVVVETSLDGQAWNVVEGITEFAKGSGAPDYEANNIFAINNVLTQYVRFTISGNHSQLGLSKMGLSEVQFSYLPTQARIPSPIDGALDVDVNPELSWRAGRGASEHQIFFGTDAILVAARDPEQLLATVADDQYSVTDLMYNTTYRWAVDAVGATEVVPGDVWAFSTPEYLVLDDFESYNDTWNHIVFQTWIDGFGWNDPNGSSAEGNGTGSAIGYWPAPTIEKTIRYDGNQSMPLSYGNGENPLSKTTSTWPSVPVNKHGIKTLSLQLYGAVDNVPGQLFIEINGVKVSDYPGSQDDLILAEWHPWTIDLAAAGITSIETLTIGITGGNGTVFIDAIRLYPTTD